MVAWSFSNHFSGISKIRIVVSKIIKKSKLCHKVIIFYHWKGLVLLYGISAGFFLFIVELFGFL